MLEKHGIACDMMHGFNRAKWTSGTPGGGVGKSSGLANLVACSIAGGLDNLLRRHLLAPECKAESALW